MADLPQTHVVHCPDCSFGKLKARDKAASHQGRHACPNCNRGLATCAVSKASPAALAKVNLSEADPSARTRAAAPADD